MPCLRTRHPYAPEGVSIVAITRRAESIPELIANGTRPRPQSPSPAKKRFTCSPVRKDSTSTALLGLASIQRWLSHQSG